MALSQSSLATQSLSLRSVSRLTHIERHVICLIFALNILQKAPTSQTWLRNQVLQLILAEIRLWATCNLKQALL